MRPPSRAPRRPSRAESPPNADPGTPPVRAGRPDDPPHLTGRTQTSSMQPVPPLHDSFCVDADNRDHHGQVRTPRGRTSTPNRPQSRALPNDRLTSLSATTPSRASSVLAVDVAARRFDPAGPVLQSVQRSSRFFTDSPRGWSAADRPERFDGLELLAAEWIVRSCEVEPIRSSFVDDTTMFPSESVRFDHPLITRTIAHTGTRPTPRRLRRTLRPCPVRTGNNPARRVLNRRFVRPVSPSDRRHAGWFHGRSLRSSAPTHR